MDILKGLNEQQKIAILESINKDTLVVASAGSGKTKVLITRLQYLLSKKNVKPESICNLTFTNKSAKELIERAKTAVGDDAAKMWAGTFHSICIKFLRMFGEDINIDSNFSILTPYYAKKQAKDVLLSLGATIDKGKIRLFLKRMSNLKNNLIPPRKIRESIMKRNNGNYEGYISDIDYEFCEFYSKFQRTSIRSNVMDFDDLLFFAIVLLNTSKSAKKFIRENFKYICADEFQDSNPSNMLFLELLSKNCNLFVVGDGDQCIYEFRGSKPKYLLDFQKRANSQILKLEKNYRSTKTIVDASNFLIEKNIERVDKTCYSAGKIGEIITVASHTNDRSEAFYVANEIKKIIANGTLPKEIYILFRTNSQTITYEKVFMENCIPYCLIGTKSFTERKEILDLLSHMRLYVNHKDRQSLKRVVEYTNGIGQKTINEIMALMEEHEDVLKVFEVYRASNTRTQNAINKINDFLKTVFAGPYSLIEEIAALYIDRLETNNVEENNTRIENIKILLNLSFKKENEGISVNKFMEEMDLLSSSDKKEEHGCINFMTMHASKGLEADVVFIVGCNESIIPHSMSLKEGKIESERRLMYVAMTRARKKLYINYFESDFRSNYEKSRFISEIPEKFIELVETF